MLAEKTEVFTPEAYLEWEMLQDIRHEYVDGHVFAMSGASLTTRPLPVMSSFCSETTCAGAPAGSLRSM